MRWFFQVFGRGSSKKKGKNPVPKLEAREERIQRIELRLVEEALRDFMRGTGKTYFGMQVAEKHSITLVNKEDVKTITSGISDCEKKLLDLKIHAVKVQRLSRTLEDSILTMRGGTADSRFDNLSEDELRVLNYCRSINKRIGELVALCKNLQAKEYERILHQGGMSLSLKISLMLKRYKQKCVASTMVLLLLNQV